MTTHTPRFLALLLAWLAVYCAALLLEPLIGDLQPVGPPAGCVVTADGIAWCE